jgi:hypothetical protein
MSNVNELVGKTCVSIENHGNERLIFVTDNGEEYVMQHIQDCCESVRIEDIVGELKDLVGTPITKAEEMVNSGTDNDGTHTWTFYHLATVNGYVTIRWYGESNGYYSESVDFEKVSDFNK